MPTSTNAKRQTATDYIPYTYPVDHHTSATVDGDYVRTIQLAGVPFETMANAEINGLSRQWFSAINSLGSKNTNVALWSHLIRRKLRYDLSGIEYDNWFSNYVNQALAKRLADKNFYVNELYLSPVYRTAPGKAEQLARKMSKDIGQKQASNASGIAELEKITNQLMLSLRRYHPTLLGAAQAGDDGQIESDAARFYSRILNGGESGPVNVQRRSIRYAIQRHELNFRHEVIEIEKATRTQYVAVLGIKAPYGIDVVRSDILSGLLQVPAEFILSQSITFLTKADADKFLKKQEAQIASTSNNELMLTELKKARQALEHDKFSMGAHEFILAVYADSMEELSASITAVEVALQSKSLDVIRENSGMLISQYFSMLPGNFTMGRLRAMPVGTDNFSKLFPMHNFTTGNVQGSQWGMPLALFETTGGGPYFFNWHVNRKSLKEQGFELEYFTEDGEPDSADDTPAPAGVITEQADPDAPAAEGEKQQRKESGNYQVIGANGAGKTVVQALIRVLTRKKPIKGQYRGLRPYKSFTYDKDCGQELPILAAGGAYFRFEQGKPTGINMFSLPDNERSRQFIAAQVMWCARRDESYVFKSKDEQELWRAIADVYRLTTTPKRFARLLDRMSKGSGTLHSALTRWADNGPFAWVLDSKEDRFDLSTHNDFGFDMTQFLGIDEARTPILAYLFHKINTTASGSPHSIDIDEASNALKDPYLLGMIDDKARTVRKLDGVIGLSFQNAADACTGAIAATLANQFPTRIIFPNSSASRADYIDGLKLTEKEFALVRTGMNEKPGSFLIKKGHESVVVSADLSGMNNILSILSGSEDNCIIARQVINELGNDPAIWLPEFFKRRT